MTHSSPQQEPISDHHKELASGGREGKEGGCSRRKRGTENKLDKVGEANPRYALVGDPSSRGKSFSGVQWISTQHCRGLGCDSLHLHHFGSSDCIP